MAGQVVTRVDERDFIKMNIAGPDILKVSCMDIPEDIKKILQKEPLTMLKTYPLPKRRKVASITSPEGSMVPVVYIHRAFEEDDPEESRGFKFIQRHWDISGGGDKEVGKPVILVPIGEQYDDPKRKGSNRYVWCVYGAKYGNDVLKLSCRNCLSDINCRIL
jgi:hypothetical protein